jgi:hypothetical protein
MDRIARIAKMEVIDDATANAMRRLSGVERLRMLDRMVYSGRDLMLARINAQHPDWNAPAVALELARRLRDVAH